MRVVETLAAHLLDDTFFEVPEQVREKALCCVLDAVTSAVVGHRATSTLACRIISERLFGKGTASVWLSGQTRNGVGAAFCNSAAVSALDFDDGHRAARGHPGAAVIPAALTAISRKRAPRVDQLVAAIVAGYEISIRIAGAQNSINIRTRQSGRWTAYGAVAAAGLISQHPAKSLAHAMAIAGVWSPNQEANGSSGYCELTGNDAKEGIPWSVATGLTALELARAGFTGPGDILDHASHYDASRILDGLGRRWEILGTYFKPYACCRYIHPAIDALASLIPALPLQSMDILAIRVKTFQWAQRLQNKLEPTNLVEAQYSLPFCIGAAVRHGPEALSPISNLLLRDKEVHYLARKVALEVHSEIDRRFPSETLAQIVIETKTGELTSDIVAARGDMADPMGWPALLRKFLTSSKHLVGRERQNDFVAAFESLRAGNLKPLSDQLGQPFMGE